MFGATLFLACVPGLPQAALDSKPTAAILAAQQAETARALEAFGRLGQREQRELVDYIALEVGHLESFQNELLSFVLRAADKDRGVWPEESPAPFFDPAEHARAQPIARSRRSARSFCPPTKSITRPSTGS